MNKQFVFEKTIDSDAAQVWALLSQLDAVDQWAPIITSCRVEGSGAGAVRHCVMADGTQLQESILAVDEEARSVSYRIDEGLPLDRYEGVFSVIERDGRSLLHWAIEAEGSDEALAQIEEMLNGVAPAMLAGLDQKAAKAA